MIGEIVSERYKVIEYLGGGMSSVYLAEDIILNREVVVKLIKVDHHNREKSVARFQREVESTIQLSHPNIVSVLDVDETDMYHLLVTEVIHGPTLKQFIEDNHPVPVAEVLRICGMVLRGIRHAHGAGIIHRDIKPQNILMDGKGQVKITDFGIAKALSDTRMTETNQVMGSVQYISPEQAKGNQTDERTDIYSFGIVLFELLAGRLPFEGETPVSVALKHISEPFPDILEFREVPEALVRIIGKCTEKDPHNRYRQVDEILNDIAAFNSGTVSQTHLGPSPLSSHQEDRKKNRKLWLIPLLAMLLLLPTLFFFFVMDQSTILPDMNGMPIEDAGEILEENGLEMGETIEEYDPEMSTGSIISTVPGAGGKVDKGTPIDIIVSRGEAPYKMEDFVGGYYEDIKGDLDALGFSSVEVEKIPDASKPDTVLSQSIGAGMEVTPEEHELVLEVSSGMEMPLLTGLYLEDMQADIEAMEFSSFEVEEVYDPSEPGTIVEQSIEPDTLVDPSSDNLKLTVSKGLEMIEVEDYRGQQLEEAEAALIESGFEVDIIQEAHSADFEEGQVMGQSPHYGEFTKGSTIDIIKSLGPEPKNEKQFAKEVLIPYDDKDTDSKEERPTRTVEIYIDDKDNDIDDVFDTLEIDSDHEYTINMIIEEDETGHYRIDVDGETVKEDKVPYK
ncbi:serine/threonine protein kinase Stk1 [Salinicoccus jeotgali]|uniref:non-specific serine/threonine protein kinase n=1 Tax=Salinicoccus jeotgali TaxID=381634 RepID=A0ABP7ELN5_9STAP